MGDYQKSKINLEELVRRFPESNLKDEALLWTGRSVWKLGQFTSAESGITSVLNGTDDRKLLSVGNEMLADIYRDRNDDENETKYLRDVILFSDDNQQKAETYYRIGLIQIERNEFKEAINSFQKVEIQIPTPELLIKAKMESARALKHMGKTMEALDILQAMLDSDRYKKIKGEIQLEIAEIASLTGDVETAIEHYGAIAIIYSKSEVAMKAWYKLADLHTYPINNDNKYINYPYGKTYFIRAKNELKKGLLFDASLRNSEILEGFLKSSDNVAKNKIELIWLSGDAERASDLLHQLNLNQNERLDGILPAKPIKQTKPSLLDAEELAQRRANEENLSAELDESGNKELLESAKRDSAVADSIKLEELKAIQERKENLFKRRDKNVVLIELIHYEYLMAEYYQLDLDQPDSARVIYEHILSEYSDSEFAPRSALSLGIIHLETNKSFADSMFNLVLRKYPGSPSTIEVNRRLNTSSGVNISIDPESALYEQAYNKAFINKNEKGALEVVELIENNYPGSYFAAKAAYLRAYIIDNSNDSPEISLKEYKRVIDNYSKSEFANEAKLRIARLKIIMVKPKERIDDDDDDDDRSLKESSGKSKKVIIDQ